MNEKTLQYILTKENAETQTRTFYKKIRNCVHYSLPDLKMGLDGHAFDDATRYFTTDVSLQAKHLGSQSSSRNRNFL
jgi:hypothetical protein